MEMAKQLVAYQHEREAENEFLRLSIHEHGTLAIYGKRTGKNNDH